MKVTHPPEIHGLVLAGGRSRRMDADTLAVLLSNRRVEFDLPVFRAPMSDLPEPLCAVYEALLPPPPETRLGFLGVETHHCRREDQAEPPLSQKCEK